jgi:hypothetical protein
MKENLTFREYLNEQKNQPELKPDQNFVLNLKKKINNQIEYLEAGQKVQEIKESKQNRSFLQYKWAFASAFSVLLLVLSLFGVYIWTKQSPSDNPDQIVEDNRNAAQILAFARENINEIQAEGKVLYYELYQKKLVILPEIEGESNTFCKRWINYLEKLQRDECGLWIEGQEFIKTEEKRVKQGEELLEYPEISLEYYENLFDISILNGEIINELEDIRTVRTKFSLQGEGQLGSDSTRLFRLIGSPNEVIMDFDVNINKNLIEGINIYYVIEGETFKRFELLFRNIEARDEEEGVFTEKPQRAVEGIDIEQARAELTNEIVKITFNNLQTNPEYLILFQETMGEVEYIETKPTISNSVTEINLDLDGRYGSIIIKPFYELGGELYYGEGIVVYTYPSNNVTKLLSIEHLSNHDLGVYVEQLENDSLQTLSIPVRVRNKGVFENDYLSFDLPKDWEITELRCEEVGCNGIVLNRDYKFYLEVDSSVLFTGGDAGFEIEACSLEQKTTRINDQFNRVDFYYDYLKLNSEANDMQMCEGFYGKSPNKTWVMSYIELSKGEFPRQLFGINEINGRALPQQGPRDDLVRIYIAPGPYLNIGTTYYQIDANDPKLQIALDEMSKLVGDIEFKK